MSDAPLRLGPWEIGEEIGRGGYGTVYRARHERTGAAAAVKVFLPEGGATPGDTRRFQREVALARVLDHPGIVRVLDVGEGFGPAMSEPPSSAAKALEGRVEWFAMDLIEGVPLDQALAEEALPWRRAVEIVRDVADALAHAHARGILHRDVKPGNILLGRKVGGSRAEGGGETAPVGAYLSDFGLARLVSTGSRLTRTGFALGTPEYMSPEQAMGESDSLTPATDVWSLGCVLYEALAGRPAFEEESDPGLVEKVILGEPVPLGRVREDVPRPLARVVAVCLAKSPRRRYRDAGALRDDLDRVLRGERLRARPPRGVLRRLFLGATLLGASVAAGLLVRGSDPAPPAAARATPLPVASRAEARAAKARALSASEPREAARLLDEALALDPTRHPWRIEAGLLLWSLGEGPAARARWSAVPRASPEGPAAALYAAMEAFGRGDPTATLEDLEGLARGAGRVASLAGAAALTVRGRWAEAREALAALAGWEAALLRGYVESGDPAGDRARSFREYGTALEQGPILPWALTNRGACLHSLGDPRGALAEFEAALRRFPGDARALTGRAAARGTLGDTRGAIEDLDRALALDPRNASAFVNRAQARRGLGDLRGALADLSAALEVEPGNAEAWNGRGTARLALGDPAGAVEDFTEALRLRPDHALALYHRGNARAAQRLYAEATLDYTASLRVRPEFAHAHVNRGNARSLLGDVAGALEDYEAALRLEPDLPEALANRGGLRLERGEVAEALEDFRAALARRPDYPMARQGLARCEARLRAEGDRGR